MTPDTQAPAAPSADAADGVDYRDTVFLPKTDFPMRAGLPKKEPALLADWADMDLHGRLRDLSKGREKYVLHDGPPYANGHLHIGHAVNKILKDVVVRSWQMMGRDSVYVPGWDCHGLPIEWKIEEQYRAKKLDKDDVPVLDFRRECREFAQHWVGVQTDEFQRMGVMGDWTTPYMTMTFPAEAQIVREIHKFLLNGSLYRGLKPVMWSVVEKTALAEAEVEYQDFTSDTIYVRFPVARTETAALQGADVVIWTTTPWTMPGNRALAYGAEIAYGVYEVVSVAEERLKHGGVAAGDRLVLACALAEAVTKACGIDELRLVAQVPGTALQGTVCHHPLHGRGDGHAYGFEVPCLPGDFVTTEQGTGIVHIAPGHGEDDFALGRQFDVAWDETVDEDGSYFQTVPLFAGARVYTRDGKKGDANPKVIAALAEAGKLLGKGRLKHTYPHSWRSKAPLIYRATAQWFISMETTGLRATALEALRNTKFVPRAGYNRLSSMIETRPDWCISRQRAWGVPIALFVHKQTGTPLTDPAVLARIAEAFETDGADAWYARDPQEFLGADYAAADYTQVFDIVDVWFESGSTHSFVLEQRPDLKWPADIYLEGSDQHRGWFHSSLLESCGTRGRAPYDVVLTHGFVLDENGFKMSKSRGNVTAPQDVMDRYGADILRLWTLSSDYSEDLRIGDGILKYTAETYRRLRNTLRYLLGALADFDEAERLPVAEMPELERWVLHRVQELDTHVRRCITEYEFHDLSNAVHQFCNTDLSAFYFDVRKDSLYCDRPDSVRRRATRTVMDTLFDCLTAWLAPALVFTTEEAWTTRHGGWTRGSVHERVFPEIPADWRNEALAERWEWLRRIRRVVTGALEIERAEKRIRASLEAHPTVYVEDVALWQAAGADGIDAQFWADLFITSQATVLQGSAPDGAWRLAEVPGVAVVPGLAEGRKCARSWRVLPEVGSDPRHPELSLRDADAVEAWRARRAAA